MNYLLVKQYTGKAITGSDVKLQVGSAECKDNLISVNDTPICFSTSQVAYQYFADNYDGKGDKRGKWIDRIAYWRSKNSTGYRLNDDQRRILSEYYPKYIRHDCDTIIFNDKFYHLPIETYEMMGQDLGMKLEDMA